MVAAQRSLADREQAGGRGRQRRRGFGVARFLLAFLPAVLAGLGASPALAVNEGYYVGGGVGFSVLEDRRIGGSATYIPDIGPSYMIGGVFGYRLKALRLEGEVSYRQHDIEVLKLNSRGSSPLPTVGQGYSAKGAVAMLTGMANAYLHLPVPLPIDPYVGLGVGIGRGSFEGVKAAGIDLVEGASVGWAGQVMVGANLGFMTELIGQPMDFGVEYRYLFTKDMDVSDGGRVYRYEFQSHNFLLTSRYFF